MLPRAPVRFVAAALLAAAGVAMAAQTPAGRQLQPVGQWVPTPNFPTQLAVVDAGVAVLFGGADKQHSLRLYDFATLRPLGRIDARMGQRDTAASTEAVAQGEPHQAADTPGVLPNQSFFQGLAAGRHGTLYVAGGDSDNLVALDFAGTPPRLRRSYPLTWQEFPRSQYPYQYAGNWQQRRHFYPDSVAVDGDHAWVTGLLANSLAEIDLATGSTRYLNVGSQPYAVVLADHGRRLVVSDWAGNGITVVDRDAWRVLGRIDLERGAQGTGPHPTALVAEPDSSRVWVAETNRDRVVAVDLRGMRAVGAVSLSPYRGAEPGSQPDALAIGGGRLFVANAGNNMVAAFDLATRARLALIPSCMAPSALAVTHGALYVACAKGMGSGPNPDHAWVGSAMPGALQRVDLKDLDIHAGAWTRQALAAAGFEAAQRASLRDANAKATRWLRDHIDHVVLILRENKTFDQSFGLDPRVAAWADPKLGLYGQRETPNLYAMAAHGALFVDFYADGEVTSQGHQWVTAAASSDYIEKTWPLYYSNRGMVPNSGWTQSLAPDAHDARNAYANYQDLDKLGHWSNPWVSYPPRRFLFDSLLAHHVSFEDFGEFVSRDKLGRISPAMREHIAVDYAGWDDLLLDTERAALVTAWLQHHPLPAFTYVWLPDDHTAGKAACMATPDSYVADNDLASARVIEALSKRPEWSRTLVLLTEDDAQSGADHVDAHRSFAVAFGPWVAPGRLVAQRFSQVDLIRTIEAITGLPALSQWDGTARVIDGIWRDQPDASVFEPLPMQVSLRRNPGTCKPDSPFAAYPVASVPGTTRVTRDGLDRARRYGPTTLMTVAGGEQMRQVWLATRGPAAYRAMMAHLHALAEGQRRPLSSFVQGRDDDD